MPTASDLAGPQLSSSYAHYRPLQRADGDGDGDAKAELGFVSDAEVWPASAATIDSGLRTRQPAAGIGSEPAPPRRLAGFQTASFLVQILLTVCPLLFVILAASAIAIDGKPHDKSSRSQKALNNAIALSPTVFPIVFAAVVGNLLRAIGLYGVEHGIKIGVLERLIGSTSLFSALQRQVTLRSQYMLGVCLLVIWALSPLGGQAALRLLSVVPYRYSYTDVFQYMPLEMGAALSSLNGGSGQASGWSSFGPIYMTALSLSFRLGNSSTDLYGNVLIPNIDAVLSRGNVTQNITDIDVVGGKHNVDGDGDGPSAGEWLDVIASPQPVPYASLIGVPVVGLDARQNASFSLVSRYFAVSCSSARHDANSTVFQNNTVIDGETAVYSQAFQTWSEGGSFYIDTTLRKNNTSSFTLTSVNGPSIFDVSSVNCSVAPRDVEAHVTCQGETCRVDRMRNRTVDLAVWSIHDMADLRLGLQVLPITTVGVLHHGTKLSSSLTELWLQRPYASNVSALQYTFANLSTLSPDQLSSRLTVVINTFWQSSFGSDFLMGGLSTTDLSRYQNLTHSSSPNRPPLNFNTTNAIVYRAETDRVVCHRVFAGLLLVISIAMFLAGAATLILMQQTLAPDLLGSVSTLTRDNPYASLKLPSYWSAEQRTTAMHDMYMVLGDVKGASPIGHVALAVTADAHRLQKDRLYD